MARKKKRIPLGQDGKIKTGKGVPSKFDADMIKVAAQMAKEGKTQPQIADVLGVDVRTYQRYLRANIDFRRAVKEGLSIADEMVEASLFRSANGFMVPETKVFCSKGVITKEIIARYYPPDPRAQEFWLKNRKRAEWRERTEVDNTSSDGTLKIVFIENKPKPDESNE